MKLFDEIKEIKTGEKELKSFGKVVGGIFLLLGLLFLWRGKPSFSICLGIGIPLIVFGFISPKILKWIYLAWMSLGLILGAVMAPVILALLYFIGITPISLIGRATGKKFLDLDFKKETSTYWVLKDNSKRDKKSYETQF